MRLLSVLLILAATLASGHVFAQTPAVPRAAPTEQVPSGETVFDRPRPEYDPIGIRAGGFWLFPAVGLRQVYNSNVYATERNQKSDFITILEPTVDLRSNWNNHALDFHADAGIGRYWKQTDEDYEDFTLLTSGRLDVTRQTQIFASLGYRLRHEARSSPDDVGGRKPTEYSVASGLLGVQHRFNRLSFRLDAMADRYDYRDTPAFVGGSIDQSGRDRDMFALKLRAAYEFAPLREVYLLTSLNHRDYRKAQDASGVDRDSSGYEVALGLKYDLTGVMFIDIFLGYSQQDYQESGLKTASGPSGGAKLTWNVTRLTTLTGLLSRDLEETTLAGSSSYFATKGELRVDHELLRNLILSGVVGFQQDSFEGISREDSYFRAGASAKYLFDRNFSIESGYTFRTRSSDVANNNFDESLIFLRLIGRL